MKKKLSPVQPSLVPLSSVMLTNLGVIFISLDFKDREDAIQKTTNEPELDMRPINEAYKTNQEELSNKSTCSRNLTHQGVTEKKNDFKIFPYEEDIQLPIRHTSSEPELDQRMLKEGFQSNQDEPSCESTCFRNLTHPRSTENWNHIKNHYGLEVIQFLNQVIPDCPYLEAPGFNQLQNRFWRPGEAYNQQSEGSESLDKVKQRIEHCKEEGHTKQRCWILNPHLKPSKFR